MFKSPANPWEPPDLDEAELWAFKSLSVGKANEHQQLIALKTIMQKFSGVYDQQFRPGGVEGERSTCFAAGKAFVGQRIEEAIRRPVPASKGDQDATRSTDQGAADRRLAKPERSAKDKPNRN